MFLKILFVFYSTFKLQTLAEVYKKVQLIIRLSQKISFIGRKNLSAEEVKEAEVLVELK